MSTIKCKSGLKGWRRKLRSNYESFGEFESYDSIYGLAARLGYPNAESAWRENPLCEGSTVSEDFRRAAPRGIVCYDNGGKTVDRYTVYYRPSTGHKANAGRVACVGMSARPFHPQGIGQHSEGMLGRHNGKRISFHDLPADCQKLVWQDLSP